MVSSFFDTDLSIEGLILNGQISFVTLRCVSDLSGSTGFKSSIDNSFVSLLFIESTRFQAFIMVASTIGPVTVRLIKGEATIPAMHIPTSTA